MVSERALLACMASALGWRNMAQNMPPNSRMPSSRASRTGLQKLAGQRGQSGHVDDRQEEQRQADQHDDLAHPLEGYLPLGILLVAVGEGAHQVAGEGDQQEGQPAAKALGEVVDARERASRCSSMAAQAKKPR